MSRSMATTRARKDTIEIIEMGVSILDSEVARMKELLEGVIGAANNPSDEPHELENATYLDDHVGSMVRGLAALRANIRALRVVREIERAK